jgi:hypothetical protein
MSVYASRWALDQLESKDCTLSPITRSVVLILAMEANYYTGKALSGRDRMADILGRDSKTIWRAVRELRDWAALPFTEVDGKGITWFFPVSPDVIGEVDPGPEVVHTGRDTRRPEDPEVVHTGRDTRQTGRDTRPGGRERATRRVLRDSVGKDAPVTSSDDAWFPCAHPGCLLRVDPQEHRLRCPAHDARRATEAPPERTANLWWPDAGAAQ